VSGFFLAGRHMFWLPVIEICILLLLLLLTVAGEIIDVMVFEIII
jgi:hypothetical protein